MQGAFHWSKVQFKCLPPQEDWFLLVGPHLSSLLVSVPLSQNPSWGLVFKFFNHLVLSRLPNLWRRWGQRQVYLHLQLLAGCLACCCEETEPFFFFFLPFQNHIFCVNSLLLQTFSAVTLSRLLLSWSWSARSVTPSSRGHPWVFFFFPIYLAALGLSCGSWHL